MRNRLHYLISFALLFVPGLTLKDIGFDVQTVYVQEKSEAAEKMRGSKHLSASSISETRNLAIWGGFMTFVHCHTPGKKHDHCPHPKHNHRSDSGTHSSMIENACNDGQCFDSDGNPCYGSNCTGVVSSTVQQPTQSPSTEISNDMCWYCIGNSNADLQNNNFQGIMYGGLGLVSLVALVSMALRRRNMNSKRKHLLNGSVSKRMMTVASRFELGGSMVDFDEPNNKVEIVTNYYKA